MRGKERIALRWRVAALIVTMSVNMYIALYMTGRLPNRTYKEIQRPMELPACPVNSSTDEVTVLTAYFNIGPFAKNHKNVIRKPQNYFKWIEVFKYIDNPFIAYTNDKTFYEKLRTLRSGFSPNRSRIFLIDQSKLWSFSIANEIKLIYSQPGYPKFLPGTVNENYSCVTHAKFELLQVAIKEQYFHTKYIAWVDAGLYRKLTNNVTFHVTLPPKFEESKVSFHQMNTFENITISRIIKSIGNWVAGGMLIGRIDRVMTFTEDYVRAVKELIKHKLMHSEEQVIYAMYLPTFYFRPRLQLQTFHGFGWYGLAHASRVMGLYKGRKTATSDNKCALIVNRLTNQTFPLA